MKYIKNNIGKNKSKLNQITVLIMLLFLMFEPDTYITYYFFTHIKSFILLMIFMACTAFFYQSELKKDTPHLTFTSLLVFLALISLLLICKLIHLDESNYYFSLIMYIFEAFIFCYIFSVNRFIDSYLSVMKFLALYSVIVTYLVLFFPSFFSSFLPSFSHYGSNYYQGKITFLNALFCNVYIPDFGMQYRNYGIFREPGVFQFYLLLALILQLFYVKKADTKSIVLLCMTVFSTFSTVGIILEIALLLYYLFFVTRVPRKYRILAVAVATLFVTLVLYIPAFQESYTGAISKLAGGASYNSRWGSLIGYFYAWLQKPIFGWGYTGGILGEGSEVMRSYTADNTNTTFTNFAIFGIIYGLLHLVGIIRFCWLKNRKANISCLFVFCILIVSMNTQRFLESPIIFMLIFYSYGTLKHMKNGEFDKYENSTIHRLL